MRTALAGDATWSKLDEATRLADSYAGSDSTTPPPLAVATDDDLLRTLDGRPLAAGRAEIDAVDARTGQALQAAAEWIEANTPPADNASTDDTTPPPPRTTAVRVRRGTLPDEAAVREWLGEQEEKLVEAVRSGPVIVR